MKIIAIIVFGFFIFTVYSKFKDVGHSGLLIGIVLFSAILTWLFHHFVDVPTNYNPYKPEEVKQFFENRKNPKKKYYIFF